MYSFMMRYFLSFLLQDTLCLSLPHAYFKISCCVLIDSTIHSSDHHLTKIYVTYIRIHASIFYENVCLLLYKLLKLVWELKIISTAVAILNTQGVSFLYTMCTLANGSNRKFSSFSLSEKLIWKERNS